MSEKEQQPFYSIIISLFNKDMFIKDTIKSVINQTEKDWELIIVDNGSTDFSWKFTQDIIINHPNINAVKYLKKQGPGACRNHGLELSKGKWILFLDADDLIAKNFLELRKKKIESDKSIEILASKWREFYNNNISEYQTFTPSGWSNINEIINTSIGYAPWIIHAAVINKKLFNNEKKWVEELDLMASEDTAFWFRIIRGAKVSFLDDDGALYRILKESRNSPPIQKWISDVHSVLDNNVHYTSLNNLSAMQSEILFRSYEKLYILSKLNNLKLDIIETMANRYLKKSSNSIPILIRKFIGFKNIITLRQLIKRT